MSTKSQTYSVSPELQKNNIDLRSTAKPVMPTDSYVTPADLSSSLYLTGEAFQANADPGTMLVKSITNGEVKKVEIKSDTILRNTSLGDFEIRDGRVKPKHNFTKADSGMVNIHAHKGPDEPSEPSTGWGRR